MLEHAASTSKHLLADRTCSSLIFGDVRGQISGVRDPIQKFCIRGSMSCCSNTEAMIS
jgi:hypothetical protein